MGSDSFPEIKARCGCACARD